MSKCTVKTLSILAISLLAAGSIGVAQARDHDHDRKEDKKEWNKDHPRRAEVNGRLENQDRRINKEEREGEISKQQAQKLHQEDRQIRKEERQMAAKDGGHITKQEQQKLNQQENAVSQQIGK